jgi:hypothetical protein
MERRTFLKILGTAAAGLFGDNTFLFEPKPFVSAPLPIVDIEGYGGYDFMVSGLRLAGRGWIRDLDFMIAKCVCDGDTLQVTCEGDAAELATSFQLYYREMQSEQDFILRQVTPTYRLEKPGLERVDFNVIGSTLEVIEASEEERRLLLV